MKKLSALLLFVFITGCSISRPLPLPSAYAQELPWGAIDLNIESKSEYSIKNSLGTIITQKANAYRNQKGAVPFNILTLTGGGSRGAFGTGLIVGWNDSGNIPRFDIITGVSTGAIMAPFVFLGDEELKKLEYFYTKVYTEEVFNDRWFSFFSDGYIMNAEPLRNKFKNTFNEDFLDKVAVEHKKGRRLYVATTNADTGQLVVWDMGAIASSNRSDKYQQFSDIIYASLALPVYLPPQYMQVDIEGQQYYQMHVDGGIHSQVFMIGLLVNWKDVLEIENNSNQKFDVTLYTIANRKYRQRDIYKPVEQSPFDIIEFYMLTEMDLLFDRSIYRLYMSCKEKGFEFRMVTIPAKMQEIVTDPAKFEPEKLTRLFKVGYEIGVNEIAWKKSISIDEYDNNK